MFASQPSYIGIDPTAGRRPFTYAALDGDLRLMALGQCEMEEVLAFVAGQRQAFVAICAPSRPSRGIMEQTDVREHLVPPPRPGRWGNYRVAEYLLRQHNISCTRTPADDADCPAWLRMGFTLYRRLESFGYRSYPSPETPLQWLEVYPHASFCALLGLAPFPKNTLEGRIQRQLVLYNLRLHISDPMDFFEEITAHRLLQGTLPMKGIYTPSELDALVAAYTAWLASNHPDQISTLGHSEDGQIVLPVAELKHKY
jgi:hypothetical protein